ncbi:MAG: amidohydrolase family protein, partial [Candidatus Cloacimonetes bacterium]|nr:amidohydrolase family protein [Candidatus Cloacimonadota bacterium]
MIQNGQIIHNALILAADRRSIRLVDILFADHILQISAPGTITGSYPATDLQGKLLIPGCIDAHVHFNDPGFNHHETFLTGTMSAACGGITTVIDMPCTSQPPVTTLENMQIKLDAIRSRALIDYALWGGIRGNDYPFPTAEIEQLWEAGVTGFKIYTTSGMETFQALTYPQIAELFARFPHLLFAFHAEDSSVIKQVENTLSPLQKANWQSYPYLRSVEAEETAVKNILALASAASIHFVHISSKAAARRIISNRLHHDVSLETCPHYLQFTSEDFARLTGRLKTAPSVKFPADRLFLRNALQNSEIDFVASDHAGCDFTTEKELADFSRIYSGIPGTELMIPYLFSEFYLKEGVSLDIMQKITSENAAHRYGLYPRKGNLAPGSDADFTIIDL